MTAAEYTAACEAVAGRALGELGVALGASFAHWCPVAGIDTPLRLSHFLAQVCEETGKFRWFTELGSVGYFAKYDGRVDLGNDHPGDGFRYRGRGDVMLTGRANYARYGKEVGVDLVNDPDLASHPDIATAIACAYWADHGCNAPADDDSVIGVTRLINGGLNGLLDREDALGRIKAWFAGRPEEVQVQVQAPVQVPPKAVPRLVPAVGTGPVILAAAPVAALVAVSAQHGGLIAVAVGAIILAVAFVGLVGLALNSRRHHMATASATETALTGAADTLNAAAAALTTAAAGISAAIAAASSGDIPALDAPLAALASAVSAVGTAASAVEAAVPTPPPAS